MNKQPFRKTSGQIFDAFGFNIPVSDDGRRLWTFEFKRFVNVKRELYKRVQAQVHTFIKDDICSKKVTIGDVESQVVVSEATLQGMLSHIFWVKGAEFNYKRPNKPTGLQELGFYRGYPRTMARAFIESFNGSCATSC